MRSEVVTEHGQNVDILPKNAENSPPDRWLLLRGLARERAHWFDFPERLASASGGLEVVCTDLPGAGSERMRPAPPRIGDYADDVLARLDRRGLRADGRWWVFGLSLGGMVTLELAQRFGDRLAGIAIANSSVGACPLHERLQPRAAAMLVRALVEPRIEARERAVYRLTSAQGEDAVGDQIARAVRVHDARPVKRRTVLAQLCAAGRFTLPRSVPVPLLVLCSQADRLASPNCSQRIADHFGAPCERHASAGHDLPLDAPDWLADRLASFRTRTLARKPVSAT